MILIYILLIIIAVIGLMSYTLIQLMNPNMKNQNQIIEKNKKQSNQIQ